MEKSPMTRAGHAALEAELKQLKSEERPAIIRAIAEAREHGDLSENAEYHAARERQSFIEGRIGELEDATKRAEIIDTSKLKGKTVRFGAKVKLADEESGDEITYQLVGEFEDRIGVTLGEGGGVYPATYLGFGFTLTHRRAFERVSADVEPCYFGREGETPVEGRAYFRDLAEGNHFWG